MIIVRFWLLYKLMPLVNTIFATVFIRGAYNVCVCMCIGKIYYYEFATQIALLNGTKKTKKRNCIEYAILLGVA